MKGLFHFKITVLMISALVPWPEPGHPQVECSREQSFLVRNFVAKKWSPIFDKFKMDIPLTCPLHPERDIFHSIHQSKVPVHSKQWSCSICGKGFHAETFLDLHMLRRHSNKLLLAEDNVCPAEFCDLIRCEVLQYAELSKKLNQSSDDQQSPKERQMVTALVKATPRNNPLSRYSNPKQTDANELCMTNAQQCKQKGWLMLPSTQTSKRVHCCSPSPTNSASSAAINSTASPQAPSQSSNETGAQCSPNSTGHLHVESAPQPPPSSKEEELATRIKQKQNACQDQDFIQLRADCSRLIDMCTAGLVLRMTNQQFNYLRDELNRSVCWHLQCDRYWTEVLSPEDESTTLVVATVAFVVIGVACSYIIVCVLYQESPSSPVAASSAKRLSGDGAGNKTKNQYNGSTLAAEWAVPSLPAAPPSVPVVPHPRHYHNKSSDLYYGRKRFESPFVVHADIEENSLI